MGLQIDRTTPAQTPAVRNGINRYNFLGKETQVATAAADLTLVATMGSGSTNPGNLISKTSAESQTVTAIKETVELRHYTSNKGLEGIKKDMVSISEIRGQAIRSI